MMAGEQLAGLVLCAFFDAVVCVSGMIYLVCMFFNFFLYNIEQCKS